MRTALRAHINYNLLQTAVQAENPLLPVEMAILLYFLFIQDTMHSVVRGGLRARGVIVPRHRVVDSIHRVDPLSQILRRRVVTYGRQYCVPGPNSLWYACMCNYTIYLFTYVTGTIA